MGLSSAIALLSPVTEVGRGMAGSDSCRRPATYPPGVPTDLGGGLHLRAVRDADGAERLAAFNAGVHQDEAVRALTRWRLVGAHPTVALSDFLFVEDTRTGEVVSSLGLMLQTWTYRHIPFRVGQVELVGTHPSYRGRGLVRAQMAVIARMLDATGCLLRAYPRSPLARKVIQAQAKWSIAK